MEKHAEDARRKAMVIDIDMLVPKDHLLRKIEKVMDYDWLYERLNPLYNDKVGRPGTDPVVLVVCLFIKSSIILWDENFNTTTFKQVIFGRLQNFDLSNSSQ